LNEPERTAYSAWNGSPARNSASPLRTLRQVCTSRSSSPRCVFGTAPAIQAQCIKQFAHWLLSAGLMGLVERMLIASSSRTRLNW
jgi:hypothetical protein